MFSLRVFVLPLILASLSSSAEIKQVKCIPDIEDVRVFKENDIKYWDIDEDNSLQQKEKDSIKSEIISKLRQPNRFIDSESTEECFCPKIFGPVVCDQEGNAYANVCSFLCETRLQCRRDLKPVKILVQALPGEEVEKCKA